MLSPFFFYLFFSLFYSYLFLSPQLLPNEESETQEPLRRGASLTCPADLITETPATVHTTAERALVTHSALRISLHRLSLSE